MDTLQAYETLRSQGGLEEKVAKAIVTAFTNFLTPSFADLGTKADLEPLRTATKADLAEVRTDIVAMKSEIATIKANMATKTDLTETTVELIKWMVGVALTQTIVTVTLVRLLS